ncbi:MAG: SDR family oxidoreductase [Flavobacteriales bacterium]|nr:SDR family oxidoreductase [Flavobacteriales bacterium]
MNTNRPRSILVTGGTGFIGSHVCDALIAAGHSVRCMDNLATSKQDNIAHLEGLPDFTFVHSDIRSAAECAEAMEGIEVVVHLAALGSVPRSIKDPLASHATNLTGFLNVLEAARDEGVGRFVYASSSSVYGDSKELPKREEHIGRPLSPYAVTKACDETYAQLYTRLHGLSTIGLRFFNVFGERQDPEGPYAAAIPKFIASFLEHRSPLIHGDGQQSRDFTYVGNAVQAVLKAVGTEDPNCAGAVFNVAFGARTTLLELVDALRDELALIDPAIAKVEVEHGPERTGDIRDSLADISKAKALLGYAPAVDLKQGLRTAVPWYVKHWS